MDGQLVGTVAMVTWRLCKDEARLWLLATGDKNASVIAMRCHQSKMCMANINSVEKTEEMHCGWYKLSLAYISEPFTISEENKHIHNCKIKLIELY